jgi:hypothetical protein
VTARLTALAAWLLLGGALAGCTHVKPYERGKLAHPTMSGATFASPAEEHVYSVQEGAVGGGASAESGCGCN